MKTTLIVTLILLMSSCASIVPLNGIGDENCLKMVECVEAPIIVEVTNTSKTIKSTTSNRKTYYSSI